MKVQFLSVVFSILITVSTIKYGLADNSTTASNAVNNQSFMQQMSNIRPDKSVLEENNYHYNFKGNPIHLKRIKDRYAICYRDSLNSRSPQFKQQRFFRDASFRKMKTAGRSFDVMTISRKHVDKKASPEIISELHSEIAGDPSVLYAAPVYCEPQSGEEVILTDRIAVKVRGNDYSEIIKTISSMIDVTFEKELMPQVLVFKCNSLSDRDALERSMNIEKIPNVIWTQPEMIVKVEKFFTPDDPLFSEQWHLSNTGSNGSTAGADMKVSSAWDFQLMADTNITIAVLDQGIDLTHPDLRIVPGWNFFTNSNNPSPSNSLDNHGTAVAGIAAAIGNNGIGVTGVAAGAKIMPIKILDDSSTGIGDLAVADAITWAWQHGADVLNNSWGFKIVYPSSVINNAIIDATKLGRNGKGCPVLFASGNDGGFFKKYGVMISSTNSFYVGFVYKKDASGTGGNDKVYIDNVYIVNSRGDSVKYLETFSGSMPPSGWTTFGGTNGSHTADNSIPGWSRISTRYQQGFSSDKSSFCSGSISDNQWTELRMPLRSYTGGEVIHFNLNMSTEEGHDSLLVFLYRSDSTVYSYYGITSGITDAPRPYVSFPAQMDSSIAVGASTDLDFRSDYSQYDTTGTGKTVDFLAPSSGGFFGTTTTDRVGSAGYEYGNYTSSFSGTSSACPAASGLAALILSKNPHLSRNKVLEVMRSTCDEIGGVTYTNDVHKEYGHGRLNARRAIENLPPVIIGQNPLAMLSNQNLTISVNDLIIFDAENPYGPFIFTVYSGTNYTVSGTTITATINSGILSVPVSINDGTYESDIYTLNVNVRSSNNPPSITSQNPIAFLEDKRYRITSSDLIIADSDNPSGPFLITAQAGTNYTIVHDSIVPSPDFNGTITVPVTASDGLASSASFNVTITVTAVNDAPSFTSGPNVSVLSTSGAYSHIWATSISPGPSNEATQTVSFTVSSTNNSLFDVVPSISSNGTLSFTPNISASGYSNVTVVCNDNGGTANGGMNTSVPRQFTITIGNNNSPPSFTSGPNVTVNEDAGAQTIPWATNIDPGSSGESTQVLHFVVTNNNSSLFTAQPSISPSGTLSFTSSPDRFGSAQVTARLYDNGGGNDSSVAHVFTITINNVNDPPTFTPGGNQTVLEDAGAQTVVSWASSISAGPGEYNILIFNVTTTNPLLFASQPSLSSNGTLKYTPAQNANGIATVRVRLFDGIDSGATASFSIAVTAVNDAPSFTKGPDITIEERSTPYSVVNWASSISAGPSNESTQILSFVVTPVNSSLFTTPPALSPSGTLTFTPVTGITGTTLVNVMLLDDGGTSNGGNNSSASQQFSITITPVNMPPSFIKGPDITVSEDTGSISISSWATSINPGAPRESGQILNFTLSNNNTVLFAVQPQISSSGTLSFTTAQNRFGTARIIARLHDNGGGNDSSAADTFSITINNVNDPPSFTIGSSQTVLEDAPPQVVRAWCSAINPGTYENDSIYFRCSTNHTELFSRQPFINDSGDLSYTLAPDANGIATVYLNLHDTTDSSATVSFSIVITGINDPPIFTAGSALSVLEDAPTQTLSSWATLSPGPSNENGQVISSVTLTSSDTTMFLIKPTMTTSGDLSFRPAANRYGSVTITATVNDNGGTANGGVSSSTTSFTITILPVNDRPSFTKGADISVNEDCGATTYPNWATSIFTGFYENTQTFSFSAIVSNQSLFSHQPAIDGSGALSFTPANDAFGLVQIRVRLHDSGGTEHGGIDSSEEATFNINVLPINDPPRLFISGNYELTAGSQTVITISATDPDREIPSIDIPGSPSFSVVDYPGDGVATVTCYPSSSDTGTFSISIITEDNYVTVDSTINIHVSAPLPGQIYVRGVSSTAKTCINATSGWLGVPVLTGPGIVSNLKNGTYSFSISETGYKTVYYYGTIASGLVDTITFIQHTATPIMFSSALPLQTTSGALNAGGLVSVVIDDADNDRKRDIIYTGIDGKIYMCKGNGISFSDPSLIYSGTSGRNTIRCIDYNNDGFNDLLLFNVNGPVWLCRGKENGQFQNDTVLFNMNTQGCTGMDIAQQANGNLAFYTGFSDGTIQYFTLANDGSQQVSIVRERNGQPVDVGNDADVSVLDLSGDGKVELIAGNSSGVVKVFTLKSADTVAGSFIFSTGGIPAGLNGRVSLSSSIGVDSTLSVIVFSDNSGAIYRTIAGVRGDVTDDGKVDVLDLQQLGIHWGKRSTEVGWTPSVNLSSSEPVTGSQIINVLDLQVLGSSWGLRK
jgi:subtilisin family serine protease